MNSKKRSKPDSPARFAIGIDLGTTNCAIAYSPINPDPLAAPGEVRLLSVEQLVAPATTEARPLLASFMHLGSPRDAAAKALDLPWAADRDFAVGALAAKMAADAPTRTVAGAKSWLVNSRVDRHEPILPWNAPADVQKVSPVEASVRYLSHLAAAWARAFPDAPIEHQKVVLTVPASFDASARELTREAAIQAGLGEELILLEEPQASLYAWLADAGDRWRRTVKPGDTLLVCDVGGGTTDFTLIAVAEENGELALNRLAVGNHILVGGDNMDLALAVSLRESFAAKGINLDPWQSVALWHSARAAKETLLGLNPPEKHPVTVLGRGSKLIGAAISVDLDRQTTTKLLLEGFLPENAVTDGPQRPRASGFREIGLAYESDTAITRHLADFLMRHGPSSGTPAQPTYVLFNGGVFKASALRQRILDVMGHWFGPELAPKPLEGEPDLDFAVARGAAYYAGAKSGRGVRIRGGTARSYYVGIETAGPAIPGIARPLRALCVVPFGMEEGDEADVPAENVGVVVGEQTTFRFFSSPTRKNDKPGDVITSWSEPELSETDSIQTTLPTDETAEDDWFSVKFRSRITELGMLELFCESRTSDHRWKLEFSVRDDRPDGGGT